jgi:acylphosphatase
MKETEHARLRLVISGRVQGVFFRASAVEEARSLGLTGWARNRPDGGVEIVAEGKPASLRMLLAWAHQGPPSARVEQVEEQWGQADGGFSGFSVR